jgi:hypothetical protein
MMGGEAVVHLVRKLVDTAEMEVFPATITLLSNLLSNTPRLPLKTSSS